MDDQRHTDLDALRQRVSTAAYRVDPDAVAESIVRRRWVVSVARARVTCVARREAQGRAEALAA